jgi:hypothetical protein
MTPKGMVSLGRRLRANVKRLSTPSNAPPPKGACHRNVGTLKSSGYNPGNSRYLRLTGTIHLIPYIEHR